MIACAPLLVAGACEKKTKPNDTGAVAALDNAATPPAAEGPTDTTPLPGIDVSKLEGDKAQLFYKLIGSLKSPCGKAHSLRTSFTSDTSCKRAPFAVRYVLAIIEDEGPEDRVREEYGHKYEHPAQPVKLDTSHAPHVGANDAPIKLVEFYDYECPHCQAFKAQLEQVEADKSAEVGVSFLMFPIESKHPEARSAAQAALAADQQGKFKEMHDKLFAPQAGHGRDAVMGYAKELGLDMAKFQKAYDDTSPQVTADLKQGEDAGVDATPTLFFNDRRYEGPMVAKYIEMWIDEDLAVNR
ncbi:MAG TPA: thioredoxin domain-containing protein [Kofleriaceae bacterium]|nr:thioredoxin domain-containing protein [Kofleriaceae bacterium]